MSIFERIDQDYSSSIQGRTQRMLLICGIASHLRGGLVVLFLTMGSAVLFQPTFQPYIRDHRWISAAVFFLLALLASEVIGRLEKRGLARDVNWIREYDWQKMREARARHYQEQGRRAEQNLQGEQGTRDSV